MSSCRAAPGEGIDEQERILLLELKNALITLQREFEAATSTNRKPKQKADPKVGFLVQ